MLDVSKLLGSPKELPVMAHSYFVRIGVLGHIGRFGCATSDVYHKGQSVLCRTARGLEVGEALQACETEPTQIDGSLLRALTTEDHLVLARLQRNKDEAYEACQQLLAERSIAATLVDVEQTFDGASLFFYFLGEVSPAIESVTRDLASAYEAKVQFREFADAVQRGCGPDCGTESAAGCGSTGGCISCAVASACHAK